MIKLIQGVAAIKVKLHQMSSLAAGMVQIGEPGQSENPSPVPNVVATDGKAQPPVKLFHPVQVGGGLFQQVASLELAHAGFDHPGERRQVGRGKGDLVQPHGGGLIDGVAAVGVRLSLAGFIPGSAAVVNVGLAIEVAGQCSLDTLLTKAGQGVEPLPRAPALFEGADFQVLGVGNSLQQSIQELDGLRVGGWICVRCIPQGGHLPCRRKATPEVLSGYAAQATV